MIDISNLSYDELTELEKTIRKQKDEYRKATIEKSTLYNDTFDLFDKRYPCSDYKCTYHYLHDDISDIAFDCWNKTTSSIIKICDVALKNYHEKEDKIRVKTDISKNIEEDYSEMFNEIFAIFCKYANKYDEERGNQNEQLSV